MSPAKSFQGQDWTLKFHGPGTHFPSPSPQAEQVMTVQSHHTGAAETQLEQKGDSRPQGGWGWGCQKMEQMEAGG